MRPSVITAPDWVRRPSGDDLARVFPVSAQRRYLSGRATISCSVAVTGWLQGCEVASEDPPGEGFGKAALRLAPLFRMRPTLKDGVPVSGGVVRIPIRFLMPDLRAAPVPVRDANIKGVLIELNCRYQDGRLDDCFPMSPAHDALRSTAIRLAEQAALPPLPRPAGRITIPLQFSPY